MPPIRTRCLYAAYTHSLSVCGLYALASSVCFSRPSGPYGRGHLGLVKEALVPTEKRALPQVPTEKRALSQVRTEKRALPCVRLRELRHLLVLTGETGVGEWRGAPDGGTAAARRRHGLSREHGTAAMSDARLVDVEIIEGRSFVRAPLGGTAAARRRHGQAHGRLTGRLHGRRYGVEAPGRLARPQLLGLGLQRQQHLVCVCVRVCVHVCLGHDLQRRQHLVCVFVCMSE